MRTQFVNTLTELAEHDERIVLLTGDLGYTVLEPFAGRFPDRYFNVGVAEQNMVGIATGLAEAGMIPFVYSIATFATMRPYEFIRNGPAKHRLQVRIVGVGGGLDYAHNGISHFAIEDVGIMRIQPNITVVVPADRDQTKAGLLTQWERPGPIYFRLSRGSRTIHELNGQFQLGRAAAVGNGRDLLIVTMGSITSLAIETASLLQSDGIKATVVVVSSFNPSPVEDLLNLIVKVPLTVSIEDHYVTGGVGSLVAEIIASNGLKSKLLRCGLESMPSGLTGSTDYLYTLNGLTAQEIVAKIRHCLVMKERI